MNYKPHWPLRASIAAVVAFVGCGTFSTNPGAILASTVACVPRATPTPSAKGNNVGVITNVSNGSNINKANFLPTRRYTGSATAFHLDQPGNDNRARSVGVTAANSGPLKIGRRYPLGANGFTTDFSQLNPQGTTMQPTHVWRATSGTIIVDSYTNGQPGGAGTIINFRIINARFKPFFEFNGPLSAHGTFAFNYKGSVVTGTPGGI